MPRFSPVPGNYGRGAAPILVWYYKGEIRLVRRHTPIARRRTVQHLESRLRGAKGLVRGPFLPLFVAENVPPAPTIGRSRPPTRYIRPTGIFQRIVGLAASGHSYACAVLANTISTRLPEHRIAHAIEASPGAIPISFLFVHDLSEDLAVKAGPALAYPVQALNDSIDSIVKSTGRERR